VVVVALIALCVVLALGSGTQATQAPAAEATKRPKCSKIKPTPNPPWGGVISGTGILVDPSLPPCGKLLR
jgi:hypothetical protein